MFRDKGKHHVDANVVGAGSVISGGITNDIGKSWLICANGNSVFLIDNAYFTICSEFVEVEDVNYLSSIELRKVMNKLSDKLGWTFTDFFISTSGMKQTTFKNLDSK